MRKITNQAVQAFVNSFDFKSSNTEVYQKDGFTVMALHGNEIAKMNLSGLFVRSAGWETNTTKERLNGIPQVSINQKNFVWYLNGEMWGNSNNWTKVQ